MKIKVYGSGCPKCRQLEENTKIALSDGKKKAMVEKVTDMEKIIDAGIMMTPALEIDGKIVSAGKVLSPEEIKKSIK
ncbi:MAG: TM0996/MTH895 family glutaredoxin-like protein [Nanoarchaeota archaeon]|nr:TM0996/MTH895 family glutaredoxin-like protein [Nanoarchaeota archaeon]